MSLTRLRLLLLPSESPVDIGLLEILRTAFDVEETSDVNTIIQAARTDPDAMVLLPIPIVEEYANRVPADATASILQFIGEGVGVIDGTGSLTWTNSRLREYPPDVRERFRQLCATALTRFNGSDNLQSPSGHRRSRKFNFDAGEEHFEVVTSPADTNDDGLVTSVVGVLWDVTSTRRLLDKLDAIDAAGSELVRIEPDAVASMNTADRLRMLEEKIVQYAHDLLSFDNFEVRMLDQKTKRLDLVITRGIIPAKIGEVLFADTEGSGISGYVAATGESYLCPRVGDDPLYRSGLPDAASSLTVPLRLQDRVIGTLNIESLHRDAFDDNDRQFATIFGRYIAMAMHILNLLVVERIVTNEQVGQTVLGELSQPLDKIIKLTEQIRTTQIADGPTRRGLEEILEAATTIRRRVEACTSGTPTVLGADQEFFSTEPNPALQGKRVLVADDDDEIRRTVGSILRQRGCEVRTCRNGLETIDTIREEARAGRLFDLVISDIRMPDRSGYDVFHLAKELNEATPVILMTGFGYDPHHSIVRASQEGLHSFLFKPFKAQQLVTEVEKALVAQEC